MVNIFFMIVAAAILSTSAFALGIAPSKYIREFNPGEKVKYGIDVVNNANEELEVIVYSRGEFTDKVKIGQQILKMGSDEKSKRVDVEFTMPDKIDTAGQHTVEIVAVGSTPARLSDGAVVKADIAVISKLIIDVPYPGKYIEARMSVLDSEPEKPITVILPVFNKGKDDVQSLHAEVDIYDADGKKVDQLETGIVPLNAGESHKFTIQSPITYAEGEYTAKARIQYDDKLLETDTAFSIGQLKVELKSLVVNEFTLGKVAKFDILLYNPRAIELKNVYADMQITDENNKVYADFKTVAVDLQARQIGRLEGYWYTEGVMPGVYTAKITLHYADKISQKMYELDVYPDRIVAREADVVGKAISSTEEANFTKNGYLILIMLVMAGVIVLLAVKLRKKGKQETMPKQAVQQSVQQTIQQSVQKTAQQGQQQNKPKNDAQPSAGTAEQTKNYADKQEG
jgi:hypothetical protein